MKRKSLIAASVIVSGLCMSAARAEEPNTAEMRQQIEQLQAKVQQLESHQAQSTLAPATQITAEQIMQDATKHSQLMQADMGFTAGYTLDRGFVIQDQAGDWVLHPNFQFQFREIADYRQSVDVRNAGGGITGYTADDDVQQGFEVRRLKLGFDGKAFGKVQYFFLWATGQTTGTFTLEQGWVRMPLDDSFSVRAGQIVNPVFHEQTTSSKRSLAVDRSLTNQAITGTSEAFSQAVTIIYDPKSSPVTAEVGIEDGFVSANSDFTDPSKGGTTDWGAFGRVNYFVFGPRKEYDDYSALGNKEALLVIGGGGDVTQTGDSTTYLHTVDVQWEDAGHIGIYAAYYGNYTDVGGGGQTYKWGGMAQAGYMVDPKWEVFGRLGYFDTDTAAAGTTTSAFWEVTTGVNWFVSSSHAAKLSLDVTYLPNGAPDDFKGLDILSSDSGEFLLRAQFQLLL